MEEITLKKDRVLEAANKCSTAKRTLEILCPEFFDKPKQDGWYKDDRVPFWMFYFKDGARQFGFNHRGDWTEDTFGHPFDKSERPATPQEIEKALISEAEKRGFKNGIKFLGCEGIDKREAIEIGKNRPISYSNGDKISNGELANCGLYCENSWIYRDGKWAEILPSKKKMTLKEVEDKLGYEIEITNA